MIPSEPLKRRNLQPTNVAKNNWIYTPPQVREMYRVVPNTLSRWVKAGLKFIEHNGERLFRGGDLNEFHRVRRQAAKRKLGEFEVYCVTCKCNHSLLDDPISHGQFHKAMMVAVICPQGASSAPKFMSMRSFEALCELLGCDPRAETPD